MNTAIDFVPKPEIIHNRFNPIKKNENNRNANIDENGIKDPESEENMIYASYIIAGCIFILLMVTGLACYQQRVATLQD